MRVNHAQHSINTIASFEIDYLQAARTGRNMIISTGNLSECFGSSVGSGLVCEAKRCGFNNRPGQSAMSEISILLLHAVLRE